MTKQLMIGAALCALTLAGAQAQSSNPGTSPGSTPMQNHSSNYQQSTRGSRIITTQQSGQWLASKFKGTDVIGDDGNKIGDVSDLLFDGNGKVEAYVVSVGGFLGMGAKDVALAPSAFSIVSTGNNNPKLKLSMTKDELKEAQNFVPADSRQTTGSGNSGGSNTTRPTGGTPSTNR